MRYRVTHTTRYECHDRVSVGHNEAWLRPLDEPGQKLLSHELTVDNSVSMSLSEIKDLLQRVAVRLGLVP